MQYIWRMNATRKRQQEIIIGETLPAFTDDFERMSVSAIWSE